MDTNDIKIVLECTLCKEKELQVYKDNKNLMQCIGCGFSSSDDLIGNMKENKTFSNLDPDMKQWGIESQGQIWIPSVVNLPVGLLYPANDKNKMRWFFAPLVDISKKDKNNYKKEDGTYYTKRYDMENQVDFDTFKQAIFEINTILSLKNKSNAKSK